MDHKRLIASLPPEARAALHAKSDRIGLAWLALHWGAILAVGAAIAWGAPGWQGLVAVQGVLIIFCFTLMHETTHATPFATRWMNEAVMCVCGVLLILPPYWFRYFHFAHHKYTNDPARDPELAGPRPSDWRGYLWAATGVPVWKSQIGNLLRNAAGRNAEPYLPAAKRPLIAAEARVLLLVYAALGLLMLGGQVWIFWCWLAPIIIGQPVLRLYLMAEHGRCPPVANMLENSRTTFTNAIIRRLAWNMPYHAEHHAMPNVPFHRLPDLHAAARPHLRSTSDGYVAFHQGYREAFRRE